MQNSLSKIIKNFTYSFLANFTTLLSSVLLVFFVPKYLGVDEYSYWQLYTFYIAYVGFFHFGWADGIYLKYGGYDYKKLKGENVNTQFYLLLVLEVVIAVCILISSKKFINDYNKHIIFCYVALNCVLLIPKTFLQYILQATNRIKICAINIILEKIIYTLLILLILFSHKDSYIILLFIDILTKIFSLLLMVVACRDIIFSPVVDIIDGIKEAYVNINIGIKLMFANIAGLLINGVIKFSIERQWDITTFGKVSLSMTVSNTLMIFINAISVVMYPLIRKTKLEDIAEIYCALRTLLMAFVLGVLVLFYPVKHILSLWLPQYSDSLKYMSLLLPICVYESKMSMLINTYLKALRLEKTILRVNIIAVFVSLLCAFLFAYLSHNLFLTIISIPILLEIRCILAEISLSKHLHLFVYKDIIIEIIISFLFMFINWNIESWLAVLVYGLCYIIYLFIKRKDVIFTFCFLKQKMSS